MTPFFFLQMRTRRALRCCPSMRPCWWPWKCREAWCFHGCVPNRKFDGFFWAWDMGIQLGIMGFFKRLKHSMDIYRMVFQDDLGLSEIWKLGLSEIPPSRILWPWRSAEKLVNHQDGMGQLPNFRAITYLDCWWLKR